MMPCLRLCLFVALTFPLSAHAATYKCVVEGKTTYQQLPCDANAAQREIETGPRHAAPPVRSIPAAEAAPAPGAAPKGALDAAGREALARDAFAAELSTLGWHVLPGIANFLLCHVPESGPDAETVVQRARARGLYVRNAAAMGLHLGDRCVRIAVKDRETNRRMAEILRETVR